jgi:hypothetical protein
MRIAKYRNAVANDQTQQTKARVIEPAEHETHDHTRQHERREEQRLHNAHPTDMLIQIQREQQAKGRRKQEQREPDQVVLERRVERVRVEQFDVVIEAGECLRRHPVPVVKTEGNAADDRIHHAQAEQRATRQQEEKCGAVLMTACSRDVPAPSRG